MAEYNSQYTGAQIDAAISKVNAMVDAEAYGLPILYLTGDTASMSKDNAVTLNYVYGERNGTCTCKWQGSSSLSYPKKNYTIKFDNAFEAADGWGEQEKYCFKANYIDHSHARNIVNAKLWGQIVKTRGGGVIAYNKDTQQYVNNAYSYENGVLTSLLSASDWGMFYLKDFSVPESGFTLTCEAFFPAGATDLKVTVNAYRKDTGVSAGYLHDQATSSGVWESLTFETIWAAGSASWIALQGDTTSGVKFRNIRAIDQVSGAVYTFEPSGEEFSQLVNGGAVDGFPCVIMLNGEFHGLYTWNIPKDGWMFGMSDPAAQQAILCADTQNDACGFKALATLTDDFDLEYVSDESNSDWVLTSLNTLINACMNSDGTDLDSTIAQYLNWDSVIDYYIFTVLIGGNDMVRKNYLLVTLDGAKWYFSAYDMDTTYGLRWDGAAFDSALAYPKITEFNHKAMELARTYKANAIKARYAELRGNIFSEDNIYLAFSNWAAGIPSALLDADVQKWPTIPSSSISNTAQILNWYRMRIAAIDKDIEYI